MRSEVRRFYPDIGEERIHIVGTPQFEPYADPGLLWSREEYCRRVGADPERPIICYSGCDADTCPDDPIYVEIIAEMVERGELEGNPQLLVRPAPVPAPLTLPVVIHPDPPSSVVRSYRMLQSQVRVGDTLRIVVDAVSVDEQQDAAVEIAKVHPARAEELVIPVV